MLEFGYYPREADEHVWRLDRFYCKKFLQCLSVLVFVMWLLYQIDYILRLKQAYAYNHIQDFNFQNEQIEKLLGRKGGIVLYQTALSRAAKQMIQNTAEDNKENENSEGEDVFLDDSESWIRFGEFSTREYVKGRNEDSIMKVGAVILKNGEQKLEVSKHDSGPSRRTDIQVEVNESRSGIPSKEMVGVEEIKDVTVAVGSGQAAMRDLLQNHS